MDPWFTESHRSLVQVVDPWFIESHRSLLQAKDPWFIDSHSSLVQVMDPWFIQSHISLIKKHEPTSFKRVTAMVSWLIEFEILVSLYKYDLWLILKSNQPQNAMRHKKQRHLPASMSASSMKLVVRMITRPARRLLSSDHRWRRAYGPIPLVGSSINITCGHEQRRGYSRRVQNVKSTDPEKHTVRRPTLAMRGYEYCHIDRNCINCVIQFTYSS